MHGQVTMRGGLKGVWLRTLVVTPSPNALFTMANILIDNDGHARLADFGLLTIVSESTHITVSSSSKITGTTRWMSPGRFGFKHNQPTKGSDCYALGMVILEVHTGQAPFPHHTGLILMRKVVDGEHLERPRRPEAVWFTDHLWEMLQRCWSPQPKV